MSVDIRAEHANASQLTTPPTCFETPGLHRDGRGAGDRAGHCETHGGCRPGLSRGHGGAAARGPRRRATRSRFSAACCRTATRKPLPVHNKTKKALALGTHRTVEPRFTSLDRSCGVSAWNKPLTQAIRLALWAPCRATLGTSAARRTSRASWGRSPTSTGPASSSATTPGSGTKARPWRWVRAAVRLVYRTSFTLVSARAAHPEDPVRSVNAEACISFCLTPSLLWAAQPGRG